MAKKSATKIQKKSRNPVNLVLLAELNNPKNPTKEWDSIFDLYNWLEDRGASPTVLTAVENLISENADLEALEVKRIVQDLLYEIQPSFGIKSRYQLARMLKPFRELTNVIDLGRFHSKVFDFQTEILNKTIDKLRLHDNIESKNMVTKIEGLLQKLSRGRHKHQFISEDDITSLEQFVGVDRPGEAAFILSYLNQLSARVVKYGQFVTRKDCIKVPPFLRDDSHLQYIEIGAYEKLLRNGKYEMFDTAPRRKAFIKNAYLYELLDYLKKFDPPKKKKAS